MKRGDALIRNVINRSKLMQSTTESSSNGEDKHSIAHYNSVTNHQTKGITTKDGRTILTGPQMRQLREQVFENAKNADGIPECAWCGTETSWTEGEMHHDHRSRRDPYINTGRGMAGSKRNDIASEMKWLCKDCHGKVE